MKPRNLSISAAVGNAAQVVNFKDVASGTFLKEQFGELEKQVQAGTPFYAITNVPWFENQMGGTVGCQNYTAANYGISLTCAQLAAGFFGNLITKGISLARHKGCWPAGS